MRLKNGDVLLRFPVNNPIVTAGWVYNDGSRHGATDFRAAVGTPVYAAEDGVVNWLHKWRGGKTGTESYGNAVKLRHNKYKNGVLETRYAHLSKICVEKEQIVREGDIIGYSGETGNTYGAHLHFEVLWCNTKYNPLNWLSADFTFANSTVKKNAGKYKSVTAKYDNI